MTSGGRRRCRTIGNTHDTQINDRTTACSGNDVNPTLGGSPELIGTAIVASHPGMSGVIFDQPDVVKVAQAFIEEYGINGRMEVMGGDYMTDPIGDGYDLGEKHA